MFGERDGKMVEVLAEADGEAGIGRAVHDAIASNQNSRWVLRLPFISQCLQWGKADMSAHGAKLSMSAVTAIIVTLWHVEILTLTFSYV